MTLNMHSQPSTRISSGVIVAHLTPTLYFFMALAQSTVTVEYTTTMKITS